MHRYRVRVVQSTAYLYEIEAKDGDEATNEATKRAMAEFDAESPGIEFEWDAYYRPLEPSEGIFDPEDQFIHEEK